MIRIETPRLILRIPRMEDLDALHAMLTDPAVTYYMPELRVKSLEETRIQLERSIRISQAIVNLGYNLAIADQADQLIGALNVRLVDGAPGDVHYGLGYFIASEHWNHGYAAEAVAGLLTCLFRQDACRISASALAENLASRRVLEKCGFAQEGLLKAHTWHDGQWKDCAVYRLLKTEYEKG